MKRKIFWCDVETTGLESKRHCIIQLAYMIEIDGEIVLDRNIQMKPMYPGSVDEKALDINGKTHEEIMQYPDCKIGYRQLLKDLGKHIDKFNPDDKFIVAGYNVNFDIKFLRQLFERMNDKYYGSWFFNVPMDIYTFVAHKILEGMRLPNYKLLTVCSHFGITVVDAHDAKCDIDVTRKLYKSFASRKK